MCYLRLAGKMVQHASMPGGGSRLQQAFSFAVLESYAQALETAVSLLQKCASAGQMIADRQLHAALRLLLAVKAQLSPAPAAGLSDSLPRSGFQSEHHVLVVQIAVVACTRGVLEIADRALTDGARVDRYSVPGVRQDIATKDHVCNVSQSLRP